MARYCPKVGQACPVCPPLAQTPENSHVNGAQASSRIHLRMLLKDLTRCPVFTHLTSRKVSRVFPYSLT